MYSFLHWAINTFASVSVVKISRLSNSSLSLPLKDSMRPFSHGCPSLDEECLHPQMAWPSSDSSGCKLRSVVRADVLRNASQHQQVKQAVKGILRRDPAIDHYGQTLSGVLIDYSSNLNGQPSTVLDTMKS